MVINDIGSGIKSVSQPQNSLQGDEDDGGKGHGHAGELAGGGALMQDGGGEQDGGGGIERGEDAGDVESSGAGSGDEEKVSGGVEEGG